MLCECGCGEMVSGAFKSGHEHKFLAELEQHTGGSYALRSLVSAAEDFAAGNTSHETLTDKVRQIFDAARPSVAQSDERDPASGGTSFLGSVYRCNSYSMSDDLVG